MASPDTPAKPSLSERMTEALREYGPIALTLYLVIFVAVLSGFAVAIKLGFEPDSVVGSAGTLASAWVATKLTQPLRILATLALTPVVARLVRRFKPTPPPSG